MFADIPFQKDSTFGLRTKHTRCNDAPYRLSGIQGLDEINLNTSGLPRPTFYTRTVVCQEKRIELDTGVDGKIQCDKAKAKKSTFRHALKYS